MSNFLEEYLEFSSAVCEAPLLFHKYVGLFVLSATLGRSVFILNKGRPIFPNIFVIIVGPSAKVQKSSVGELGVECLDIIDGIELYQDRLTRAYLGERLAVLSYEHGESVVSIFVPEMRTAFNETTLQEGIMEILTRLYDCPPKYEYRLRQNTQGGKLLSMQNPCVSMLCCSTKEWLTTGLSKDEVGGGFAGRCLVMFEDKPLRRDDYSEEPPPKAVAARQRAQDRLVKISQLSGKLTLEPAAANLWNSFRQAQDDMAVDETLKAFHNRRHSHMFKLASLLSVSESDRLVVTERNMLGAIDLLEELAPHMKRALSGVAPSKVNVEGDRILDIVRETPGGWITRGNLVRELYNRRVSLSSTDLDAVLNILESTEPKLLERFALETHKGKRMALAYRIPTKDS